MEYRFEYPDFKNFRISEHIQFFDNVIGICQNNNPTTLLIETPFNNFVNLFNPLKQNFKKQQGSDLTEKIIMFDERRDTGNICLNRISDAYTSHFDINKKMRVKQFKLR